MTVPSPEQREACDIHPALLNCPLPPVMMLGGGATLAGSDPPTAGLPHGMSCNRSVDSMSVAPPAQPAGRT
jgi:hypothetical protein